MIVNKISGLITTEIRELKLFKKNNKKIVFILYCLREIKYY